MTPKICFILSSVGGPRMLSPLFSGPSHPDAAFLVIQRDAGDGLLEVLAECLREELHRKVSIAGRSAVLKPGEVHFLSNERNYAFKDGMLSAVESPGRPRLSLDRLFFAAAESRLSCAVIVLSGILMDDDGLAGLARLSAQGAPILACPENQVSVFDMAGQLKDAGLIREWHAPKRLLENLRFAGEAPAL